MLFLVGAGFLYAVYLMAFATDSGKSIGFLVKNFWISLGGFMVSGAAMLIFETPVMPSDTEDMIFCIVHLICVVICNWLCIGALTYISAANVALFNAFQVPIQLIAQMTFLAGYVKEGTGLLQVAGAFTVFLVVFSRPLLHIYFSK